MPNKIEITNVNIEEKDVLHVYSSGSVDTPQGDYQVHLKANDNSIDYGPTGISVNRDGNFIALKSIGTTQVLRNLTVTLIKDNKPLMTTTWRFNGKKWEKEK